MYWCKLAKCTTSNDSEFLEHLRCTVKCVEENIYGVVRCGVVRGSGCEVWCGERKWL